MRHGTAVAVDLCLALASKHRQRILRGSMTGAHDDETIAFYDREATAYAAFGRRSHRLDSFITRVGVGARVLELGCGAGHDAEALIAAGMEVTPTDASNELAMLASSRIGRPVRVMRFDELSDLDAFDGVWANASLLHVPSEALANVLARVLGALRVGGYFFASFKSGNGESRDKLGRYYNFPNRAELERCYALAGPWSTLTIEEGTGGGYDGVARAWFYCAAVK